MLINYFNYKIQLSSNCRVYLLNKMNEMRRESGDQTPVTDGLLRAKWKEIEANPEEKTKLYADYEKVLTTTKKFYFIFFRNFYNKKSLKVSNEYLPKFFYFSRALPEKRVIDFLSYMAKTNEVELFFYSFISNCLFEDTNL